MSTGQGLLFEVEVDGVRQSLIEQIQARGIEPSQTQVDAVTALIQNHLRREAGNRQLEFLWPEDLCPAQKRDMVRDLARLLRD